MSFYQKIVSFFQPSTGSVSSTEDGRVMDLQRLRDDRGSFIFEADGFSYPFKEGLDKFNWSEVERIVAYKLDRMTTDEICLDIVADGWQATYTEMTPGWYQFLEKLESVFPTIPADWDAKIALPAFARNYTVLWERGAVNLIPT
jgi:hypothetical protein